LCSLLSFCDTLSGVVSVHIPVSVGWEAVLSSVEDLRTELKINLELVVLLTSVLFCWEEEYFHWWNAVTVLEVQGVVSGIVSFHFSKVLF